MTADERYKRLTVGVTLEEAQRNDVGVHGRVGKKQVAGCQCRQAHIRPRCCETELR